ncbi:MAG: GNAT family N-acetyltransferase [Hyphomicrobiales bacterium]|nr:GNAT family N-acetyltransferase [Hyphomicrobiales bacterium]
MAGETMAASNNKANALTIDRLTESDLPEAARIFRVAFGAFLGAPNPENLWTDRDYVAGRHRAGHVASFAARLDGKLVGSNFVTNWGSVGFFGPLTVLPDLQGRGVAQALLGPTMAQFDAWGTRHAGLFTFAHSTKHVGLYQKFGFYPRFLTAIMAAPARRAQTPAGWSRFGALTTAQQEQALRGCREVTESIYPGLDLGAEIRTAQAQGLGDTMLIEGAGGLSAFAVCHYGPRSEAGAATCFVKFGAVRNGSAAGRDFLWLIEACEALAADVGMANVLAGVNTAHHEAYRLLAGRGYRSETQGVAMHKNNDPDYARPGTYVINDWR